MEKYFKIPGFDVGNVCDFFLFNGYTKTFNRNNVYSMRSIVFMFPY